MPARSVGELTRRVPVLEPGDTIRRAAGLIRESGGSRLFVRAGPQIVGSVSERSIAAALGRDGDPDRILDSSIEPLVEPGVSFIDARTSVTEAANVLASGGHDVMPVVDDYGGFYGAVYLRDIVGALAKTLRPPTVGGMATPLGVYLTTGSVSAGAGDFGLFLTGVAIGLLIIMSHALSQGLLKVFGIITGVPISTYLDSVPLTLVPNAYDIPFYASTVLSVVFFMVLMRLSPLAGYHAAEHMTVHAIESGEDLSPQTVSRMQRVHPRCGTNLLAGAGIFLIIVSRFGSDVAVIFGLAVVILGWRAVGGWLQYLVTTKNPSERQLASGIAAGRQLLERYQECPGYVAVGMRRVWKLGFPQTLLGLMAAASAVQYLAPSLWP